MIKAKTGWDTTLYMEMRVSESPKQAQCICNTKVSFLQHKQNPSGKGKETLFPFPFVSTLLSSSYCKLWNIVLTYSQTVSEVTEMTRKTRQTASLDAVFHQPG